MRLQENMDSDTIRFSMFQSMAAQQQRWTGNRKMNSVTGDVHFVHACDYGSKRERRIEGVFYESIDRQ